MILYVIFIALVPPEVNLDDLCGDVMNMNLNGDEEGEVQSKSAFESGYGQTSTLAN